MKIKLSLCWLYAVITTACLSMVSVAAACVHPETGAPGVRTPAQEYAVVYANGRQTLLLSTQIAFPEGGGVPQGLSLVTATPSLPDVYETGDPALFEDLYAWFNPAFSGEPGRGDVDGPGGNSLEVLPSVETGPYTITPIMASGAEGVTALNTWLMENGFETIERALAQSYVDRSWYFLAVAIQPDAGSDGLSEGRLPPLHLEFATPEVVLPLKLEAGMGAFDVRMYLFLDGTLPDDVAGRYGLETGTAGSAETRPASVTALLEAAAARAEITADAFEVFELHSDGPVNTDENAIADWPEDFRFALPTGQAPGPGAEGMGGMPAEGMGGMSASGGAMPDDGGAMAAGGSADVAADSDDDSGCSVAPNDTHLAPLIGLFVLLLGLRRRS